MISLYTYHSSAKMWSILKLIGNEVGLACEVGYTSRHQVHTCALIPPCARVFVTCSQVFHEDEAEMAFRIPSLCPCFVFPSKTGLVTTAWDRLFFFTQGGNLMCQPRGAVAGGMVLDLDNSSVMAVDCEDRRYCFQITSPSGKTCADTSHTHTHTNAPGLGVC